ncbi:hypothetical protein [Paenibacillus sp. Y412MC10]|uniref:hypothetical protein n=1 Tax=Geobacillus sp. (strain Y412MC10) TaxID=481743 RepID=UPI0011A24BF5|nr:hypothetical protein [Paenibacillus sp. Y412MC10]
MSDVKGVGNGCCPTNIGASILLEIKNKERGVTKTLLAISWQGRFLIHSKFIVRNLKMSVFPSPNVHYP